MTFYEACTKGNLELVKKYLNEGQDPSSDDNASIRWASEYGRTDVVKLLLSDPRVDPSSDNNASIRWASRFGHTDVVKLLLSDPRVDPSSDDNTPIRLASRNGHTEAVKLLSRDVRVISSLKTELKKFVSEEEYNAIVSEFEEFFI